MKKSELAKVSEKESKKCFVIMPFRDSYFGLYKAIRPEVEACGYVCENAADTKSGKGMITQKVVTAILNADVIIAILTGRNANVMYELGLAHSFKKPTILISGEKNKNKARLPFDVGDHEAILYTKGALTESLLEEIAEEVGTKLRNYQKEPTCSNPITTALLGCNIFVDDFREKWLWGYTNTYKRKERATETWVMASDLSWYTDEGPYPCLVRRAIRKGQKFYVLVTGPRDDEKINEPIKLAQKVLGWSEAEVYEHLKILHTNYKAIADFSIYDPNPNSGCEDDSDAIFWEPMAADPQRDPYDKVVLARLKEECSKKQYTLCDKKDVSLKGGCPFSKRFGELKAAERWQENTFDIHVAPTVVKELKKIFKAEWNEAVKLEIESTGKYLKGWRID